MRCHRSKSFIVALLATVLLTEGSSSERPRPSPVLSRDIDKRALPEVKLPALSPKMQQAIRALLKETEEEAGTEDAPASLRVDIQRIPVAQRDHGLYLVALSGKYACAPAGVNCTLAVFDETQSSVTTIVSGQLADMLVVRRPNLQVPDIAAIEQLGHFAQYVTVYRFDGHSWLPYACKQTSITGDDDPHPELLADAPCDQQPNSTSPTP